LLGPATSREGGLKKDRSPPFGGSGDGPGKMVLAGGGKGRGRAHGGLVSHHRRVRKIIKKKEMRGHRNHHNTYRTRQKNPL